MPENNNNIQNEIDVLAIGDSSIDLFMKIPDNAGLSESEQGTDLPKICFYHGSKIMVESFKTSVAGNALHIATGTKLLGLNSAIYTEIGADSNADRIIKELNEIGVNTRYCIKNEGSETDLHTVIVFCGERTIFSYHGKRNYNLYNWGKPKFIYYTSVGEGFEQLQEKLLDFLNKNPETALAFNPGTIHMKAGKDKFANILKRTAILFVNKEEAEKITDIYTNDLKVLHEKLQILGPKVTVITDGEKGASGYDGTNLVIQEKYSDERPLIDKTGAGDAFSSGFLSAIIYGKSLKEALKWGAVNSGCAIKAIGSTHSLLTYNELKKIVDNWQPQGN